MTCTINTMVGECVWCKVCVYSDLHNIMVGECVWCKVSVYSTDIVVMERRS